MDTLWLTGRNSVMFEVASSEMSNDSGIAVDKTKDGIKSVACQTITESSSVEIQDLDQPERTETTERVQITENEQTTNAKDTSSSQQREAKFISGSKSPKRLFESRKVHPITFEDVEI